MALNFKPASQNGFTPPTPTKYNQSKLGLIASTTSSTIGQPIILKAISDAAYYKTSPVTLYAFNPSTNQTIATTSSFIDTVQAPFVLSNLPDGQWQLWAEWPGDGPYVAKSTAANLITVTINDGYDLGGSLTVTSSPSSGSLVVGEGTATFFATITNVTSFLGGNLLFYDGHQQIGSVVLNQNHASFSTDQLTAGTHNITVQWPGGLIGGTKYQGFSTSTAYAISSATVSGASLNLTVSPSHGVFQEGYVVLTASLVNGADNYPGSVVFYKNGIELYTASVVGTTATYAYRNFEPVGSTEFKAIWDGNSAAHPRFISVASTPVNWSVVAKETPSRLSVAVTPNPTAFSAPTYFTASFYQLAGEPLVPGEVIFYADDVVVGRAPIVNDVATTSNSYIMTGTHAVYAYYAGSAIEPKFYSTRSESVSLVVYEGLNIGAPISLSITNDPYYGTTTPYIKGETQTFIAQINTSTQLTGVVNFAINGVENFSAPWINNSATTTFVFDNSGTYDIKAIWHGRAINNIFYASSSSAITSITVLDGYLFEAFNLTSNKAVNFTNSASIFTATILSTLTSTATLSLKSNGSIVASNVVSGNKATFSYSQPTVGTYTMVASYPGEKINNRFYASTNSNVLQLSIIENLTPIINFTPLPKFIYGGTTQTFTASLTNTLGFTVPNIFHVVQDNVYVSTGTAVNNVYTAAVSLPKTTNPFEYNQSDIYVWMEGNSRFLTTATSSSTSYIINYVGTATGNLYEISNSETIYTQNTNITSSSSNDQIGGGVEYYNSPKNTSSSSYRLYFGIPDPMFNGPATVQWYGYYNTLNSTSTTLARGLGYIDLNIMDFAPGNNTIKITSSSTQNSTPKDYYADILVKTAPSIQPIIYSEPWVGFVYYIPNLNSTYGDNPTFKVEFNQHVYSIQDPFGQRHIINGTSGLIHGFGPTGQGSNSSDPVTGLYLYNALASYNSTSYIADKDLIVSLYDFNKRIISMDWPPYDNNTIYYAGDIVKIQGTSNYYKATSTTQGNPVTNTSYWMHL